MSRRSFELLADWSADDPDPDGRAGVAGDGLHGYAQRIPLLGAAGSRSASQGPAGRSFILLRGRRGDLLKVIWHDGQGACLFTTRLERRRFLWPSVADGAVTISSAQLGYLLSGIDWRHPQETWRPTSAG